MAPKSPSTALTAYEPLPDRPKDRVGVVSNRGLNSLPEGQVRDETKVEPVSARSAVSKAQADAKKGGGLASSLPS